MGFSQAIRLNLASYSSLSPCEVDLRERPALEKIFSETKFDAVIHFAGLKAVGESVEKPLLYYNNNLVGTITLLKVMAQYGCKNYCLTRVEQKSVIAFPSSRRGKTPSLLSVQSVLNNTRPNINDNGTAEPAKLLLEKLFAQTQKSERQTDQHSVYPDEDLPYSNLGVLDSDLEVVHHHLIIFLGEFFVSVTFPV